MKRLALFLALLLTLGLCSCAQEQPDPTVPIPTPTAVQTDQLKADHQAAVTRHTKDGDTYRVVGELQAVTQEMITSEGQWYQSYVDEEKDIRYIYVGDHDANFINQWCWMPVGTADEYSAKNLDKIAKAPQ